MKLIIDKVERGRHKGDFVWKLVSANGEFVAGSRPETFQTRQGLEGNIDLVSQIKSVEVVDLTADAAPVVTVEG